MRRVVMFVVLVVVAIAWFTLVDQGGEERPGGSASDTSVTTGSGESSLPQEARETIDLIEDGGPYPYERDGSVFGNRERLLPQQPRGYWREYTVPTPGSDDRGARRIVAGRDGEIYYTDDHYQSFRLIRSGS